MRHRSTSINVVAGLMAIFLTALTGCAAWTTPAPRTHPYFTVESAEAKAFQSFAARQDSMAVSMKCGDSSVCDHVYFTRALLGLYESRETAEKYFNKVIEVAPQGQFAASSKAWLELLHEPAVPGPKSWPQEVFTAPALANANTALAQVADRLVRDLLDREVIIQQIRSSKDGDAQTLEALQRELADRDHKIEALLSKKEKEVVKSPTDPVAIQNLQKQLAERDRKVEELSTQLEALKRIDQEMREKVRPIRPPSTSVPVPLPDQAP